LLSMVRAWRQCWRAGAGWPVSRRNVAQAGQGLGFAAAVADAAPAGEGL